MFGGCGGLSVGLSSAGFRVSLAVDIDPLAVSAYRMNHRRTRLWRSDIYDVDGQEILKTLKLTAGKLDLLAGCPPCQGFSTVRTLNGGRRVRDSRNDLVGEFGRLVVEVRPKAVLMENVPGLARDARFTNLTNRLRRHGYKVRWGILDAADYGVPQRRKRLILFAGRAGAIPFPEPVPQRQSVREAIGDLPPAGTSEDPAHDHSEKRSERISALISRIPHDGGSRRELGVSSQLPCHRRIEGFHDIYGRMAWDTVAPTITSGFVNPSKGRFLHPVEDRTVTVREAALLQTFPPTYRLPMERGKYPVARLIGNAVPPLFARAQAECILKHLEQADRSNG